MMGFNKSRLVTFSISLPDSDLSWVNATVQVYQRLLDVLRAVPGVEAATAMFGLPPNRPAIKNNTRVADANATAPSVGQFHIVDYYRTVIPDNSKRRPSRVSGCAQPTEEASRSVPRRTLSQTNRRTRPNRTARQTEPGTMLQRSAAMVHRRGCGEGRQAGRCRTEKQPSFTCQFSRSRNRLQDWGLRRSTTWYCARRSRPRLCHTRSSTSSVELLD